MKRWAIFFGLFMVAIIALADTGHLGKLGLVYAFPGGHWVGHFMLFGLLSFVINWSLFEEYPLSSRTRLAITATLILALFIGLEEYSQQFFPVRHPDLLDFTFSCLGVASFAWLAVRLKPTAEA
jgi:VanZ family protein